MKKEELLNKINEAIMEDIDMPEEFELRVILVQLFTREAGIMQQTHSTTLLGTDNDYNNNFMEVMTEELNMQHDINNGGIYA